MDDLDRREAFLLAIFAAPDDDLPRLVFADYLEENGEGEWAELIRVQCEIASYSRRRPAVVDAPRVMRLTLRQMALWPAVFGNRGITFEKSEFRGLPPTPRVVVPADLLADPAEFRRRAIVENPEWYGCVELKVKGGLIASSKPIGTILHSPVTQRVSRLDLSGAVIHWGTITEYDPEAEDDGSPRSGFEYGPTVTLQAVEALVGARECRRFTHLDLTDNDLDNDAARAILRSNFLTRLTSLRLFDGNQLRGRTWAALQEKFGEAVLS